MIPAPRDARRGGPLAPLWLPLALLGLSSCTPPPSGEPPAKATIVQRYLTTGDGRHLLERQDDGAFSSAASAGVVIAVDDQTEMQTMVGFGASLTDSSGWLIWNKLDGAQRDALMTDLFGADGLRLSLLRQPMGATDFTASGSYSYDDLPSGQADDDLARFSIAHDSEYLLPLLRQALALNPALSVTALPWSPPAWMKASGTMSGGAIDARRFPALARYFVRFVEAYEAEGVPISALAVQNEPLYSTGGYPSALLPVEDAAAFIGRHLGPALEAAGQSRVGILGYEHNWDNTAYPLALLADPAAARYLVGTSFHCYGGHESAQSEVRQAYPDKEIWFTECSGTVGSEFAGDLAWNVEHLLVGATRNWARSVSLWNLALDQDAGPKNGGCASCRALVTIDHRTTPPTLTRNVEYYVLGHLSRFVVPGARRIDSSSFGPGGIQDVAFRNPDGSLVVLILNSSRTPRALTVSWRGQSFSTSLDAGAVATLVWDGR